MHRPSPKYLHLCVILIASAVLSAQTTQKTGTAAAGQPTAGQPIPIKYTDIALAAGVQDRLSHGRAISVGDWNGDGLPDLYIGNPGYPQYLDDQSFLLLNNGPGTDGKYTFTKGQVLIQGEIAFTTTAFDFDNDGDPDMFIGIGGQENIGLDHLFRNDAGVFTDISEQAQIRGPKDSNGNWVETATSAGAVLDFDKDGCLDLFVASRKNGKSLNLPGGLGWRDSLFRNNCDGSDTFTDVTVAAGLDDTGSSMTPAIGDFDNDGWPDIFVPHWDTTGGLGFQFYRNNHDGTFEKIVMDANLLDYGTQAGWASGVADFNNDGLLDVMVWGRGIDNRNPDSHALFINQGNWTFTNEAKSSKLVAPNVKVPLIMGNQIGDLDNDGYPDLVMANGSPQIGAKDNIWMNQFGVNGKLQFKDMSQLIDYPAPPDPNCHSLMTDFNMNDLDPSLSISGMEVNMGGDACGDTTNATMSFVTNRDLCNPTYPYRGHAVMMWDFDGDGDLDLFMIKGGPAYMTNTVEPNRMFRNDGGNANHWLFLNLIGTVSNRDAIGSHVEVVSHQGSGAPRSIFMDQLGISNFESSGPHEIHFGLGQDDTIDQITITWPTGVQTVLTDVGINQRLTVSEDTLLSSTFKTGTAQGWTPLSGNWAVKDRNYVQTGTGDAMTINSNLTVNDYTVVGKFIYNSGIGNVSLLGRSSADGKNSYGVELQGTQAQVFKTVNGNRTFLGKPITISKMSPGMSYIVRLRMSGNTIQASVDGQMGQPIVDSSINHGGIGLSTSGLSASFKNIAAY